MAFTEAQELQICQILAQTPTTMALQIAYLGSNLTTAVQSAIEAQIALWDAGAGTETVKLHPTESNKGVETSPGSDRSLIKSRIAILLERPDWASSGGVKLQRG